MNSRRTDFVAHNAPAEVERVITTVTDALAGGEIPEGETRDSLQRLLGRLEMIREYMRADRSPVEDSSDS